MGCSCKKGVRNAGRHPIVTPKQRSVITGAPKPEVRNVQIQSSNRQARLLSERKNVENKRRNAIAQRILGK